MKRTVNWMAIAFATTALGASAPVHSLSCAQGPYIIFFEPGHAFVSGAAGKILDNAISAVGNCGYARTMMAGHTDTAEDPRVAEKRLRTVRAYFAARGVPDEDIVAEGFGSTQPRIPTGPNVSEMQNRRVEITFVPWPKMN